MQSPPLAIVGMSVLPSVRLSHAGTVLKRCNIGSRNLRRRITQGLYSLGIKKFFQTFKRVHPDRGR